MEEMDITKGFEEWLEQEKKEAYRLSKEAKKVDDRVHNFREYLCLRRVLRAYQEMKEGFVEKAKIIE